MDWGCPQPQKLQSDASPQLDLLEYCNTQANKSHFLFFLQNCNDKFSIYNLDFLEMVAKL